MEKLSPVFPVELKMKKSHPFVKYSQKMTITEFIFSLLKAFLALCFPHPASATNQTEALFRGKK